MTKRPRRNHGAVFKAKVALEAIKGKRTLVELAARFQVNPNQVAEWKKQLLDRASEIFHKEKKSPGPDVKELHVKTGQLAMENAVSSTRTAISKSISDKKYQTGAPAVHGARGAEPLPGCEQELLGFVKRLRAIDDSAADSRGPGGVFLE